MTISTLLIEEPEQRFFYWRLRDSRLRQLLAETGSLGVVGSPSATTVLGSTAAMEAGQVYYLKPKKSRGLEPARASSLLSRSPPDFSMLQSCAVVSLRCDGRFPSTRNSCAALPPVP